MHPIQSECDSNNPKQHAAWCWAAGIPDPSPARPMPIPLIGPMLVEGISEMLWDFGFRHHPDLQTKWIQGNAGLGTIANLTAEQPKDDFSKSAEEFLSANNPELLEMVRNASDEDKQKLMEKLEQNFEQIGNLMNLLKEG